MTVVSRDRTEKPAPGLYNICYVNGFQIQPGEAGSWTTQHPDLILARCEGQDPSSTRLERDADRPEDAGKRSALAGVVGDWIAGCAADGFDAVEIDNLDSYTRSRGLLAEDDAVAAMRCFADAAHGAGLAVAQKNSTELVGAAREIGTDFAVAEECDRYAECDVYRAGYGDHVLVIEYRRRDFTAGCAATRACRSCCATWTW